MRTCVISASTTNVDGRMMLIALLRMPQSIKAGPERSVTKCTYTNMPNKNSLKDSMPLVIRNM